MAESRPYGIYAIVNTQNNRIYIGQTYKPFHRRWAQHIAALSKGTHRNRAMQSDWIAYGRSAFEFSVLMSFTEWPSSVYLHPYEMQYIRSCGGRAYNVPVSERK